MILEINGFRYFMDPYLIKNLLYVKKAVLKRKHKFLAIVDGRSGFGKTTIATQCAWFLSQGNLSLEDFCFNKSDAIAALANPTKGGNKIIDEAFGVANKRTSRGQGNMDILEDFQKMRVNQQFVWLLLPSMYDLDKNVLLNLADVLIHVYGKPFGRRGQFACYDQTGIKKLWLWCRQDLSYNRTKAPPNFFGSFTSKFPFDEKEYDKMKSRSSNSSMKDVQTERLKMLINKFIDEGRKRNEIADYMGVTRQTVYNIMKDKDETN